MTRVSGTGPRVVDLFAGAGLFSHAFQREGFRIVQAIELNRLAAATYAQNLGEHVEVADVTDVRPFGRCEVIIAGPPCQGFSTLGARNSTDPRNRLSLAIPRWAEVMRPRVVVIENVAAFVESRTWGLLKGRLERLGYDVQAIVCNALDFGVAQHRVRSITIASRREEPNLAFRRRHTPKTIDEAWEGLPSRPTGKGFDVGLEPTDLARARMKMIPAGGDKRDIMRRAPRLVPESWWRSPGEVTDVWGRMEWQKPSNTLRTEFVNPSKGRYIHPDQHRVISLREAARIQSIPDNFRFASAVPYVVARQIGNSVPPLLGRALARRVRDLF